jgi:hypothetical protein
MCVYIHLSNRIGICDVQNGDITSTASAETCPSADTNVWLLVILINMGNMFKTVGALCANNNNNNNNKANVELQAELSPNINLNLLFSSKMQFI